jgi:antitoxin component of MazEF toxin-antitoxin module
MMLRKKIKKYGGSLVITFDKEDVERYKLNDGDWIDIENIIPVKKEVKR